MLNEELTTHGKHLQIRTFQPSIPDHEKHTGRNSNTGLGSLESSILHRYYVYMIVCAINAQECIKVRKFVHFKMWGHTLRS